MKVLLVALLLVVAAAAAPQFVIRDADASSDLPFDLEVVDDESLDLENPQSYTGLETACSQKNANLCLGTNCPPKPTTPEYFNWNQGTWVNGAQCAVCSPGTFNSNKASTSCSACPSGETSSYGASACIKCGSAGTFHDSVSGCAICPAGSYSEAGASSCALCPSGQWSMPGSSKCSPPPEGQVFALSGVAGTGYYCAKVSCSVTFKDGKNTYTYVPTGAREKTPCIRYPKFATPPPPKSPAKPFGKWIEELEDDHVDDDVSIPKDLEEMAFPTSCVVDPAKTRIRTDKSCETAVDVFNNGAKDIHCIATTTTRTNCGSTTSSVKLSCTDMPSHDSDSSPAYNLCNYDRFSKKETDCVKRTCSKRKKHECKMVEGRMGVSVGCYAE